MSFYGNTKRIGSQSFQFDRVYPNRKAMDDALNFVSNNQGGGDGVYPGRYVLVEYGERFTQENGERKQLESYSNNYNTDLEEYGNVYDSTVWQKVFTKNTDNVNTEKYIMVAELNALAPRLTLTLDETKTLKPVEEGQEEIDDLYYGDENFVLHNVGEIEQSQPYFDEIQDTELQYLLHVPKPLELDVNESVNYHQDKFDIYHGHPELQADGANFIGWKPVPTEGQEGNIVNVNNEDESQGKKIDKATQFSKQELNMFLPAFGDVLGALYDTLFGEASEAGGIRPYFKSRGMSEDNFVDGQIDPTAFTGNADVSKILANNSEGLAGVLNALFTDNSIPGIVRYYLSADWLAKNTDEDTNIPGILNKPKVVLQNKEAYTEDEAKHYTIDFSNWILANVGLNQIESDTIDLPVTNNIYKLAIAPNDSNRNLSQVNQDAISIAFNKKTNTVVINGGLLNTFASSNASQGSGQWVGIVIECKDIITNVYWNDSQLTQADIDESASINLSDHCIIFWAKAEALTASPRTITLKIGENGEEQSVTFKYQKASLV